MGFGSYLRFFAGLVLAIDVLRIWIFKGDISTLSIVLAAAYIILSVLWFLFKF